MPAAHPIADRLRRTITGPMWHGPAVAELLADVTARDAAAHPVPGGHSIWELVLHMTTWAEIAAERLQGRGLEDPPASRDWPMPPAAADAAAWRTAQLQLRRAYDALADAAEGMSDDEIARPIPKRGHDARTLLEGVIEHGTYHGGQVALLKRARQAR